MNAITEKLRAALIICGVITIAAGAGVKLMKIQIVDHEVYTVDKPNIYTEEQTLHATRGEIKDVKGVAIVENKLGFNVIIQKASFPEDNRKANEVLLKIAKFLNREGYRYYDSLPVSTEAPFSFTTDDEDDLSYLKSSLGVNVYATAENCIDKFTVDYDIDESYTDEEKRIISGIRYEMKRRDFSLSNVFTLCEDIDIKAVTKIKEMGLELPGVEILEEAIRTNPVVDVIPHEIGTVGPIYAEEYEELRNKGYFMNDFVGKSGIEKGMESVLRGKNGTCEITVQNSSVISTEVTEPAVPGNTVHLTIDSRFQRDVQKILEDFMVWLNENDEECFGISKGAIVVLDAKDNDVLALATAPTYRLDDYIENYYEVLNREGTPLVDRATDGIYRPGSTFKTVTATAGLNEGKVTPNTTFYCNTAYQFYETVVNCTGWHQDIAVQEAIRVSCNVYFYELSRLLGIDKIIEYAHLYGLGTQLGLESGDSEGYIAGPETSAMLGVEWYSGGLLQAAIGQEETRVTPLQMAVAASTIANRGVRYKPHLVDSIYDFKGNKVDDVPPEVAQTIKTNYDYVYPTIINGMIGASHNTPEGEFSLNDLGYDVAIKTGTPQTTSSDRTSTAVIGFAPADDPVIAFSAIIEDGKNAKYLVRKLIDCYNKHYGNTIS
jgi:penicillin-binding protein 2